MGRIRLGRQSKITEKYLHIVVNQCNCISKHEVISIHPSENRVRLEVQLSCMPVQRKPQGLLYLDYFPRIGSDCSCWPPH